MNTRSASHIKDSCGGREPKTCKFPPTAKLKPRVPVPGGKICFLIKLPAVRALPAFHVDPPEVVNQTVLLLNKVFYLGNKKKIVIT